MKKLLYAAIVAFLFVGGLAAGVVHKGMQKQNGGGGETIAGDPNAVPTEAGGLSLADLGAQPTPADGTATETLNLTESVPGESPTALAAVTPEAGSSDTMADTGRSFGGGNNSDPVKSSSGSSGSTGSSSMASSDWSEPPVASSGKSSGKGKTSSSASAEPDWGSGSISNNTEYGSNAGTIVEDSAPIEPVATPRKGKGKGAVAAAPTPEPVADSGDPFNDMPTVSDSGADPFADAGSPAQPPTPDPFAASAATPAPMMAMAMPSGGGDLIFGAASKKPALVKVAQKQNGSSSIVMIELAGSARYKIIQVPKRRQVWVDFEGVEVPGGGSSVGGSAAHVREISAKFFANENGGMPIARVIVQLDDGVLTTNDRGKEALQVTPAAGTGEASKLQLTIGAKGQSF